MNTSNLIRNLAVLLLCFVSSTVFGQQSHTVYFEDMDGFSGYVEFTSVRKGFAATLSGNKVSLALTNYECTSDEKAALEKAGLKFSVYAPYHPKTFGVVVEGQAFVSETYYRREAIGKNKLHLNDGLGDFTSVNFDEDTKKHATEWQRKFENESYWEAKGGFEAEKVTELYLSDLKNEIQRILGENKNAKEDEGNEEKANQLPDLLSEAQKALWKGDLEKAKPLLEKAYKLDPTNKTMISLSQEYAKQKDEKDEEELDSKIAEGKRDRESSSNSTQHTNNSYRYNNVSATQQKIATINKAHNEFNNAIDKAFESQREQTRAAQQASRDWWEQGKARAAAQKEADAERRRKEQAEEDALAEAWDAHYRKVNKYNRLSSFFKGFAWVELNGKYGYIDRTGQEVIPLKYDFGDFFSDSLALVQLDGKYGYIDKTGNEVIPLKYDSGRGFSEGLAVVKLNGKWGAIDKTDKVVIPFKYDYMKSFSEGLALIKLNGKWGIVDKTDKVVIPVKYDDIRASSKGFAWVKLNDKWGIVDKTGREVTPLKYLIIPVLFNEAFSEGMATVMLNDKWGFIDKTGNEIIPMKYDYANGFSEGIAVAKLNGKYGFIDKTGQEVIPIKYDMAYSFSEGIAVVQLNGKYGVIDKTGKEVIPMKYDYCFGYFPEGLARVKLSGKYGFIDRTGQEVIPMIYDDALSFSDGLARIQLNGKWGYIDKTGRPLEFKN